MSSETRKGWTIRIFCSEEEADADDRVYYASLSGQERLNLLLDLLRRWGKTDERGFERVLEMSQPQSG